MDKEACRRTEVISENAQWFEDHSPVDRDPEEGGQGVSAKAITAAMLGGDCYPADTDRYQSAHADRIQQRRSR